MIGTGNVLVLRMQKEQNNKAKQKEGFLLGKEYVEPCAALYNQPTMIVTHVPVEFRPRCPAQQLVHWSKK